MKAAILAFLNEHILDFLLFLQFLCALGLIAWVACVVSLYV